MLAPKNAFFYYNFALLEVFFVLCDVLKRADFFNTVEYATTNDVTTNRCYNEQFYQ